jgi:hypothetical protein
MYIAHIRDNLYAVRNTVRQLDMTTLELTEPITTISPLTSLTAKVQYVVVIKQRYIVYHYLLSNQIFIWDFDNNRFVGCIEVYNPDNLWIHNCGEQLEIIVSYYRQIGETKYYITIPEDNLPMTGMIIGQFYYQNTGILKYYGKLLRQNVIRKIDDTDYYTAEVQYADSTEYLKMRPITNVYKPTSTYPTSTYRKIVHTQSYVLGIYNDRYATLSSTYDLMDKNYTFIRKIKLPRSDINDILYYKDDLIVVCHYYDTKGLYLYIINVPENRVLRMMDSVINVPVAVHDNILYGVCYNTNEPEFVRLLE